MKNIAVFCGSAIGDNPIFAEEATALGKEIANRGYGLVYGGADVGLMGKVADGALSGGTQVIGVLPKFLKQKELEHKSLTTLHIVDSMHERKAMMSELSDAIIALPGGWGTMEELYEMLTWGQLSLHKKPIGILNVNGFYDALLALSETMIKSGFLKEEYREMLIVDASVSNLMDRLEAYVPPSNSKWFINK